MGGKGWTWAGSAVAAGNQRAVLATRSAFTDRICGDARLSDAQGMVVCIRAGETLRLSEVKAVMTTIRNSTAPDTSIAFGTTYDDRMADRLRVTILVT